LFAKILEYAPAVVTGLVALNVALAGLAKLTKTDADDKALAKVGRFLETALSLFMRPPAAKVAKPAK
jgi:hypothetical protein